MEFGTKIHEYLEYLDLKNPNLTMIENPYIKEKIELLLSQDFLKDMKEATIYQEYEFIDEIEGEYQHGIIDLMLEYNDHIDIIDYKLKNINDTAYQKQLKGYKKYIEKITNKEINLYLYSIIDGLFLKIE
jgi:ATP-dependent helicase/nuclease subunit A